MLAAAGELNVTPGAISRQIKSLESDLGLALFVRGNSRLTLNSMGVRYRDAVIPAFDRIEAATREARDMNRTGPLTIACLPTFTLLWLLPRLREFERHDPETELRVVSLTRRDFDLEQMPFDALIDVGRWPLKRDLVQTSFMSDSSGLVAHPDYWNELAAGADEADLADVLKAGTFLATRSRPTLWNSWSERAGVTLPENRHELWFDHMYLVLEAAKRGLGFAPIPNTYVARDIEAGALVAPLGFVKKSVPYYVAWPATRSGDRRLKSFVAWLKREGKRNRNA